jgi:hypothetical protein
VLSTLRHLAAQFKHSADCFRGVFAGLFASAIHALLRVDFQLAILRQRWTYWLLLRRPGRAPFASHGFVRSDLFHSFAALTSRHLPLSSSVALLIPCMLMAIAIHLQDQRDPKSTRTDSGFNLRDLLNSHPAKIQFVLRVCPLLMGSRVRKSPFTSREAWHCSNSRKRFRAI